MAGNHSFKAGSLWLCNASRVAFSVSCMTPFLIPTKQANCADLIEPKISNHNWLVSDSRSVAIFRNKNADKQITMIGTAHTSPRSVMLVKNSISQIKPDSVVVELDKKRIGYIVTTSTTMNDIDQSMSSSDSDDNFNSISKKLLQLPTTSHTGRKKLSPVDSMGRLLAQVFQSLKSVGFTEGSEFQTAVQAAFAEGASIILGDRDIDVTLRRLAAAVDSTDRDR